MSTKPIVWIVALVLVGCTSRDSPHGLTSSNDDVGVRIVDSDAASLPLWSLAEPRELEIGATDGETAYVFDRVNAAFRLGDGAVVVADGRSFGRVFELRFFDDNGRHIRTVGRRGQGPGEFLDFSRVLRLNGDSILIFDNRNARLTIYTSDGTLAGTRSTTEINGMHSKPSLLTSVGRGLTGPNLVGRSNDGWFLVQYRNGDKPTGYSRDTVFLLVVDPDGPALDTLPRQPSTEFAAASNERGTSRSPLPFSYNLVAAPWKDGVIVGTGEAYELRHYDADGGLKMIIRRNDAPSTELTEDLKDQYLGSGPRGWATTPMRFGGVTGASPKEQVAMLPSGHGIPSYTQLHVDDARRLWVKEYTFLEHRAQRSSWTVFDSSGLAVARASMPARMAITHIAAEHVVGIVRDSLGVERVHVYRIER
jgi:hypothetical protein